MLAPPGEKDDRGWQLTMSEGPILLIEDDRDIRETLARTLENAGYKVVTAANGLEALSVARRLSIRPSVILLDLRMPILDGYGFLAERRKDCACLHPGRGRQRDSRRSLARRRRYRVHSEADRDVASLQRHRNASLPVEGVGMTRDARGDRSRRQLTDQTILGEDASFFASPVGVRR
jgi:CheY-like chemotaxis protein